MSAFIIWLSVPMLVVIAAATERTLGYLHILQLEEYQVGRYVRWLRSDGRRALPHFRAVAGFLFVLAFTIGVPTGQWILGLWLALGSLVAWTLLGVLPLARRSLQTAKKPLRPTPRAALVLVTTLLLAAALGFALGAVIWPSGEGAIVLTIPLAAFGLEILAPWLVAAATLALTPLQVIAREAIVAAARMRLARSSVVVIGITGSYGKTSTKEILAALLKTRYKVLKTPESYNTLLGVSKVILRSLRPDHEYFVVEMGAYQRGEIARLCRLAPPRVGVLTAINPQHLERFGSIENIAKAKYELIEALPGSGTAIINVDNERCRALADSTRHVPVVRYGLGLEGSPSVTASNWHSEGPRSRFQLCSADGTSADVSLRLLGRHNVANFVGAAAAAMALGLTVDEVSCAADNVEPVPHRLQPIAGAGGVTVLDDAYNSNPDGARAALEVLSGFDGSRKVLVTPGMIELGEREMQENRDFGAAAAAVCDEVILVGPRRTQPIREGLVAAGFAQEHIYSVLSIGDVQGVLAKFVLPGDVVLFENDLPDNYSE